MNPNFEIKDKEVIYNVLDQAEYGTLALSVDDIPYAVPVNFVRVDNDIYFHGALSNRKMKMLAKNPKVSFSVVENYFHGALSNRKMKMLAKNPKVSFSVVENYALIDSDFSTTEGLACPATQFFKSVSVEGVTIVLKGREEKASIFTALMQKLQPKGGYKSFSDVEYDSAIKATAVVKIEVRNISCKFKFGQHLSEERFEMILTHLAQRGTEIDKKTIKMMKAQRGENHGV